MLAYVAAIVTVVLLYKLIDRFYRQSMTDCSGKSVLITGCDTGFGNQLARRLDSKGCHVFATCFTTDGEEALRRGCSSRLRTIQMDISDESSVRKVFDFVKQELPQGTGLWGIVNNAGIVGKVCGPPEWISIQDYKDVFAVNLLGLIDLTMTFLPLIKASKGRLVNVASVAGRFSLPSFVHYSCTKYGVEAFSDGLRRQLLAHGCSVHLIEPGFYQTNITSRPNIERELRTGWQQASPETKEEFGEKYLEQIIDSLLNDLIPKVASRDTDNVVDAYEHALFAVRPRCRYVVGFDANYLWLPIQWMPEWMGDRLLGLFSPKSEACRRM